MIPDIPGHILIVLGGADFQVRVHRFWVHRFRLHGLGGIGAVLDQQLHDAVHILLAVAAVFEGAHAVQPVGKLEQAGGIAQAGGVGGKVAAAVVAVGVCISREPGLEHIVQLAVAVGSDDLACPAVGVDAEVGAAALDILDELGQSLGFLAGQGYAAGPVPVGGALAPGGGEAPVHVHAPGADQLAVFIVGGGAAARAVVGVAVQKTVRVHAGQNVHAPAPVLHRVHVLVQTLHELSGGVDQSLAVPGPVVLIAVDGKAQHDHVVAVAETVGYQVPPGPGLAVDDGLGAVRDGQVLGAVGGKGAGGQDRRPQQQQKCIL